MVIISGVPIFRIFTVNVYLDPSEKMDLDFWYYLGKQEFVPGKDHVTMKFMKGHNSIKNVGGVKVLVLCLLSDNALYLYQVLPKYLKEFQSYCADSRVDPRVVANVDAGRTHAQMDKWMENQIPILCHAKDRCNKEKSVLQMNYTKQVNSGKDNHHLIAEYI